MGPEKLIDEFVERMRAAAGTNLVAAILYGSTAAGDYVADHSDVNLLCVLRETSFASIEALAPATQWWAKQKHRPPLLLSAEDIRRSADIFSIEFLDMRRHYRVLWGEDVLKTLEIPLRWHRVQLEYELREKTILLRQHLLVSSGKAEAKCELLLRLGPDRRVGVRLERGDFRAVLLLAEPAPVLVVLDVHRRADFHRALRPPP
jgi:predicted nucleotidyltransferase